MILAPPAGPRSPLRWPQARSRWPKIGPRRPQDAPKTVLKGICSLLKIDFDFDSFWDRFWLRFAVPNASLWAPFCDQNASTNRSEIGLLKKSLQDRSKTAQDPPKTRPGSPRIPPGPPRPSQDASQEPPGPLLHRPKNRKTKSTTVIHSGHSHRSLKNRKHFHNPRGWRRWSREALFNPPPPAEGQQGVL